MALIPSVKQGQVQAGINKARAQAVKVHCSEAIAANDILVVTGIHSPSNVLSVAKADANDITKCRGPFYIADYAAASGDITPVALRATRAEVDPRHAAIFMPSDRMMRLLVKHQRHAWPMPTTVQGGLFP